MIKNINYKLIRYFIALFSMFSLHSGAQNCLPAGYPDRDPMFDVLPGFNKTPKGYGEVPFYWWQGDTLTRERLLWQLDQLKDKEISSLQINYSHLDSGGLTYGLSNPSKPGLFTDEWWTLFKWFAEEAQKRNMTVSLSDYTLGIGQGYSMDEAIKQHPELNGSLLKHYTKFLSGNGVLIVPPDLLTLTAFRMNADSSFVTASRKDILPDVKNGSLNYNFGNETWKVMAVYPERVTPSYDPMHPLSGKSYIQNFFEKFAKALPDKGSGELNFFFSDELNFRLNGNLWNSSLAEEFQNRKGYDIVPYLDGLFIDIGPVTPKLRLDYNDVVVSLSEENFFKPVYEWHNERGMIYGCDHGGRGKDVSEFGDYFRTQRWNQGPGSDQPRLSKDIIKAKVAASIAHLYNRPRVWLEGFHSSGWGTTSAEVTDAVFANFVAGYNLLSLHGLYYSTKGGWWEWAPPDNHFRMPYWAQIDPLMKCIQRLSFLLSQGYHKCDVAIIYPVEPVVADMNGKRSVSTAFEAGEILYDKGIDFDFIDYESLARAEVKNKELNVAGENYKVLIIPSMKAIRYSSLKKIEAFKNAGGLVVNIGELPQATEKKGYGDFEVSQLVADIFTTDKNTILCDEAEAVPAAISDKYQADFKVLTGLRERAYVVHRKIGKRDVYALYNFPAGSRCFFNTVGEVQLWDPWDGGVSSLSLYASQKNEGTEVDLPLTDKEIQIIVFDPESTGGKNVVPVKSAEFKVSLGNTWEFELKPSLDNKWGDFQLPANNELLGAQVRQLNFKPDKTYQGGKLRIDNTWKSVNCGYGPQFLMIGALSEIPSEEELINLDPVNVVNEVTLSGKKHHWEEYAFSWQNGVEGDYGHQGYHGLKGEMYDNFIRLGNLKEVKMSLQRVPESGGNYYLLYTKVIAPYDGNFNMMTGNIKPFLLFINNSKTDINSTSISLTKGANKVLLVYNKACETYFILRDPVVRRTQSQPVSMSWYRDNGVLPFDCSVTSNSSGLFAFESAPGLKSFTFSAYGKVTVWVDGIMNDLTSLNKLPDSLTNYIVNIKDSKYAGSLVALGIVYQPGYSGAAALPQYINQKCGKGSITLGDWSKIDGLKAYSGGAWYRQNIFIEAQDINKKLEIDFVDLVSSAELFVNGKSNGLKVSPPWKFDITRFIKQGDNQIEILIYNTLANNYTSIPTRYRGNLKSGLIGPVILSMSNKP